ncbi:MAG: hypothetical protein IPJ26_10905 [Bacteroidetes bacterium]|nr:hypothetical protein [Bacteroidota bacterium]
MLRQVETVLQMAQIDKGEIKINKENIGLKEVIESAAASMQLPVQQREGHITIDWEGKGCSSLCRSQSHHECIHQFTRQCK